MTITLDKSRAGIQGGPGSAGHLRDGESYFGVRWHNANVPSSSGGRRELSGTVTLNKSLRDDFQVGDKFGLSITAHDGAITTRTEIVVFVEAPFHGDAPPVYPNTTETSDTTTTHVLPGIIPVADNAVGEEEDDERTNAVDVAER